MMDLQEALSRLFQTHPRLSLPRATRISSLQGLVLMACLLVAAHNPHRSLPHLQNLHRYPNWRLLQILSQVVPVTGAGAQILMRALTDHDIRQILAIGDTIPSKNLERQNS